MGNGHPTAKKQKVKAKKEEVEVKEGKDDVKEEKDDVKEEADVKDKKKKKKLHDKEATEAPKICDVEGERSQVKELEAVIEDATNTEAFAKKSKKSKKQKESMTIDTDLDSSEKKKKKSKKSCDEGEETTASLVDIKEGSEKPKK